MDTTKRAKRWVVAVVGVTVVAFGVALLVLPGPAMVVIPLGLGILASEFVWARRALRKVKEQLPGQLGKDDGSQRQDSGNDRKA